MKPPPSITAGLLQAVAGRRFPRAGEFAEVLETARLKSTVTPGPRLAGFLGQVCVETAGFRRLVENTQYRDPERLDEVSRTVRTPAEARALIRRGPEAIANRIYAGRLGNGDEASGDGWRFRGSGFIQLTGRANYRAVGALVGLELEEDPELARAPATAARVAFLYWDSKGLSALADLFNWRAITAKVNGPLMLGLEARIRATEAALGFLRALP